MSLRAKVTQVSYGVGTTDLDYWRAFGRMRSGIQRSRLATNQTTTVIGILFQVYKTPQKCIVFTKQKLNSRCQASVCKSLIKY